MAQLNGVASARGILCAETVTAPLHAWPRPHPAVVAASVVLALAALLLWLRLTGPSDGARLKLEDRFWRTDGVIVATVGAAPDGLRDGDRVVAVDGRSMDARARDLFDPSASHPRWALGQTITYTVVRDGRLLDLPITLAPYPRLGLLSQLWGVALAAALALLIGLVVFARRPRDPAAATLLLATACMSAVNVATSGESISAIVEGPGFWLERVLAVITLLLGWTITTRVWVRLPPLRNRWRASWWALPLAYIPPIAIPVATIGWPGAESTLDRLGRWELGFLLAGSLLVALSLAALGVAVRTVQDPALRRGLRRVARTVFLAAAIVGPTGPVAVILLGHPLIERNLATLTLVLVPFSLAVAIVRDQLFDLGLIVNRTLVYGGLTASIVLIYVVVVGALSALVQGSGNLVVALLATGAAAALFEPLRERLQQSVNRLMYGDRDDPHAVLSRLGARLETALDPEVVLPTIVETVAQALKVPAAWIRMRRGEAWPVLASYGVEAGAGPSGGSLELPLVYGAETLGYLVVAPRAPGEPFTRADRSLLEDVAHQAGVAAHAVHLTDDLRRSREHLVAAREEERRRIRRDLHDGLGPALASLTLKLTAARNLVDRDPRAAKALLSELKTQSQTAIADIRRLVYDLRPPALDELGLVFAIREHAVRCAGSSALQVVVDAPEHLPTLPAAVEVAAYRIALEAITNVVRHADARHCLVRLRVDTTALWLEVIDDGRGISANRTTGVGLASMRERVAELSGSCSIDAVETGGTRVLAVLNMPRPER
jgi:two-component system NarL family sensor kinase